MQGRSHVKDRDQHVMITHLPHTNIHIITKIHIHKYCSNTYMYRGLFSDSKRDTFVLQTKAQQEQKVLEVLVSHARAKRKTAYSVDAHAYEPLILWCSCIHITEAFVLHVNVITRKTRSSTHKHRLKRVCAGYVVRNVSGQEPRTSRSLGTLFL